MTAKYDIESKQPKLLVRKSKIDKIDLGRITEAYAKGANHKLVAKILKVSESYWAAVRNGQVSLEGVDYSKLLEAIEKGEAEIGNKVLANLIAQSEKQAIPALFLAKQEHILGFRDEKKVEVGGEITIKLERSVAGEVIDITPDDPGEDDG